MQTFAVTAKLTIGEMEQYLGANPESAGVSHIHRNRELDGLVAETFFRITTTEDAEIDQPPAEKLISGSPEFTTWNVEDRDGLFCGTWRSTPGKWKIKYDEWEYCRILEGHSIITEDGGEQFEVQAGDSFVIRPGFSGTWEVVETTTKEYVIRL